MNHPQSHDLTCDKKNPEKSLKTCWCNSYLFLQTDLFVFNFLEILEKVRKIVKNDSSEDLVNFFVIISLEFSRFLFMSENRNSVYFVGPFVWLSVHVINELFSNFQSVGMISSRFLQIGMRGMSRSLNAKIISLVIRSASEFNLTVIKTPDTSEEYPTNWPTYWSVFHSPQNKNVQKSKIASLIFIAIFELTSGTPLIWHLLSGTSHYDR